MKAPFLAKKYIYGKAEEFRRLYWGDIVPVDIESILESKLKIEIIPLPDLFKLCNADALISSDWKKIYVDNDSYFDDKTYKMVRFSLAHEIGHWVLHKDFYSSFGIQEVEDLYKFVEELGEEYSFIEWHANCFANFLLVPRKDLILEKEKIERVVFGKNPELKHVDVSAFNSYLANPLSKIFDVSNKVIEISLNDLLNNEVNN